MVIIRTSLFINCSIQVKKKACKINANIEDVGLTEIKKYGNKKWSLNFHDKPKNQNPTLLLFFFFNNLMLSSLLGLSALKRLEFSMH